MILAQVIFGLIPAFVMVMGAMMLPIIGASWEAVFFVGAVAGTAGLCWAIFGYEQRSAKWVLLLLLIGEITMLRPLAAVLLSAVYGPRELWAAILGLSLTAGPFAVGAIHVFASAKQVIQNRA